MNPVNRSSTIKAKNESTKSIYFSRGMQILQSNLDLQKVEPYDSAFLSPEEKSCLLKYLFTSICLLPKFWATKQGCLLLKVFLDYFLAFMVTKPTDLLTFKAEIRKLVRSVIVSKQYSSACQNLEVLIFTEQLIYGLRNFGSIETFRSELSFKNCKNISVPDKDKVTSSDKNFENNHFQSIVKLEKTVRKPKSRSSSSDSDSAYGSECSSPTKSDYLSGENESQSDMDLPRWSDNGRRLFKDTDSTFEDKLVDLPPWIADTMENADCFCGDCCTCDAIAFQYFIAGVNSVSRY